MKYRVKNFDDKSDEIEVLDVKLIEARTRSTVTTLLVVAWLIALLTMLIFAIRTGDRGELHKVLDTVTYFVATAFGWYFRGMQKE